MKPPQICSYESWGSVLPDSESIRTASRLSQATFDDVKAKGRRLLAEGQFTVWKESTWSILADVQGDNGTYTVYVNANARVDMYSKNTFAYWNCTCSWSEWAFNRETFHGRMCSHVYAMYLYLSKKRHSMVDNPQTRQADASYARIRDYIGGTEFPDAISRAIRNPGGSDWEKILADVRADLGPVSLTTFDQALGALKGITSSRRGEDNSLGYTNARLKQAALSETDCLDFAVGSLSDDDFLDLVLDDPDNSGVSFDEEAIDSLVNGFIDANYDNLKPGFSRDNAVILIEDYSKELFMNRRSYRSASRKRASLGPYYKLTEDDFLEYVTSYLSEDEILAIADDDLALDRLVDQYMADERLDLSIDFDPAVAANLLFSSAEDIASDRGITASRKRAAEVHSEYPGGMEGFITDFYGVTGSRVLVTDKIAAAAAAAEYRTAMGLVQASQRDLVSEVRASAEIVSRGHYTSHRARRVPSKTAGRHFTAIERQQLIDEEGVARQYRAGLLDM